MSEVKICATDNCERPVFSKGLCSGCYGRKWRLARKAEREAAIAAQFPPKRLTSGVTDAELEHVIEGEIIHDTPAVPVTHLTATSPAEMAASKEDVRAHLEQKLTIIERDIVEANAALNEARRNGWDTSALTSVRNRLVDDETYYNKVLAAVEAGHTIIPDFPIEIFAIRTQKDKPESYQDTHRLAKPDYGPVGTGEYRDPKPKVEYRRTGNAERPYQAVRTGHPAGPIFFPSITARSPVMRATAKAMEDKAFDQIGVCHPNIPIAATRQVQTSSARLGDPLVIGQVLHKWVGSTQKVTSFIIAWHLDLKTL